MKITVFFCAFFILLAGSLYTQEAALRLVKGQLNDSVYLLPEKDPVRIFLPDQYSDQEQWPLIVYYDFDPYALERIDSWKEVLNRQGFILLHLKAVTDSIQLINAVQSTTEVLTEMNKVFPLQPGLVYTLGTERSSRMASLNAILIEGIKGTIALGGQINWLDNPSQLRNKHFVGAVGTYDFAYRSMGEDWNRLSDFDFTRAHLNVVEGHIRDSSLSLLDRCLVMLRLNGMNGGTMKRDSTLFKEFGKQSGRRFDHWIDSGRLLLARNEWNLQQTLLGMHPGARWRKTLKDLGLAAEFREYVRKSQNQFYQEEVLWARYWSYLLDDLNYMQLDNLGWWNYQIAELNKESTRAKSEFERASAERSLSYLSAMVDDQRILLKDQGSDIDPLEKAEYERYLFMLKTLLHPGQYDPYLEVISRSAQIEDFGTALYYLDLLFQQGFQDKERLYSLEHTALFRLIPEFNELVEKYLKESRY